MQWASEHEHVYFVTNNQLLDWMRDPMDVDTMLHSFGCPGDAEATACEDTIQCDDGYHGTLNNNNNDNAQ